MHLSDADLLDRLADGDLVIDPIENPDLQIQPGSIDIRLGDEFLTFKNPQEIESINPLEDDPEEYMDEIILEEDETFILHPGDFVLGTTVEWVEIPDDLIGYVEGRSTLGRLAVIIHATAGLLDPGWKGNVTLEMSNLGSVPVELTPGMRIGQLTFADLKTECDRPYGAERGSKYQSQSGVQSARNDHSTNETPGQQATLGGDNTSTQSQSESSSFDIGFN